MTVPDELLEATLAAIEPATADAEIIVTSVQRFAHSAPASRPRPVASVVPAERAASFTGFVAAARA